MNFLPFSVSQTSEFDKFGSPTQNHNPYGFAAPTGPSSQALVPYYNKVTGESWTAPSGGYTPPSADWIQGSPSSSQITPGLSMPPIDNLPGVAPGMVPVKSGVAPQQPPFMPTMVSDQNVGVSSPALGQQPTSMGSPTQNTGGLEALLTQQRPVQTPATNSPVAPPLSTGGLNSLARPQTPMNAGSIQSLIRNQLAPRAGSLPSLRIRPTFQKSFPIPLRRPPFRR